MRFVGDYHLHTFASDGRTTIARHVAAAKSRGLKEIAIADHSFQTMLCHMTEKKFASQKKKIAELNESGILYKNTVIENGVLDKDNTLEKSDVANGSGAIESGAHDNNTLEKCSTPNGSGILDNNGVRILQSIEGNIVGHRLDVPQAVIRKCDILIAGFHRYISPKFAGEDRKWLRVNGFGSYAAKEKLTYVNTEAYIAVMEKYPIDVLAHIGHLAPIDFVAVCECAARHNVYIELNAKHIDVLENVIDKVVASGVKFIVGSDAHTSRKTGRLESVADFIARHALPMDRVYGVEGRLPTFKDKRSFIYGNDV